MARPLVGPRPSTTVLVTILIGVSFSFIWSSAFSTAKIALSFAPPVSILAVRFLLSGVIAVGLAAALGSGLPKGEGVWFRLSVLGLCQNTLYLGLYFVAMTTIPAGLASIIASSLPLLMAVIAAFVLRETIGRLKILGLALGFGGVLFIMSTRLAGGVDPWGIGLAVTGVIALAIGTAVVKAGDFRTSVLMVVGLQMLVGGVTLLPIALILEWPPQVIWTWELVVTFSYIVVFPGIVATWLWFTLLARTSATNAAVYHFLNPVFGVSVAWALLGERIGWTEILGVFLVAAGIIIVSRARGDGSQSGKA